MVRIYNVGGVPVVGAEFQHEAPLPTFERSRFPERPIAIERQSTVRCDSCAKYVAVAVEVPLQRVDDVRAVVACAECLRAAMKVLEPPHMPCPHPALFVNEHGCTWCGDRTVKS